MDAQLDHLARLGLTAAAPFGFVLAGGHAMVAHQLLDRPTEDLDLFTNIGDPERFRAAVTEVMAAYQADGYRVTVRTDLPQFTQLLVAREGQPPVRVDLGYDWRAQPPAILEIGPVLAVDDAVASKVCALFGRGEARDYIDVQAALTSGRYTRQDLLRLAADRDPGFITARFAEALAAVRRQPDRAFAGYGLDAEEIVDLRDTMVRWADELTEHADG